MKKLLEEAKAKALIISPDYMPATLTTPTSMAGASFEFPVPILTGLCSVEDILNHHGLNTFVTPPNTGNDDMPEESIAVLLHSSGTTSEWSKIIPLTYRWQENVVNSMVCSFSKPIIIFSHIWTYYIFIVGHYAVTSYRKWLLRQDKGSRLHGQGVYAIFHPISVSSFQFL
jgi:hypothetical protein